MADPAPAVTAARPAGPARRSWLRRLTVGRADRGGRSAHCDYDDGASPPVGLRRFATLAGIAVVVGLIVVSRAQLWWYRDVDLNWYFGPWYDHLRERGVHALGERFADYNLPLLYLLWICSQFHLSDLAALKVITNLGDLVLIAAVYRIVAHYTTRMRGLIAAVVAALLPAVWLDSAVIGQTDGICTGFALLGISFLLTGRQRWGWFWFGVAFAFKAQAMFLLPFFVVAWLLNRRRSWTALLCGVAPFLLAGLPAVLVGLPVRTYLGTYAAQIGGADSVPLTLTDNVWAIFVIGAPHPLRGGATAFALACVALFAVAVVWRGAWAARWSAVITAAAALTMLTVYLLPGMRFRYFQPAEVLVLCYAFVVPRRWWVPLVFGYTSWGEYAHYAFRAPRPFGDAFWAIPLLVVTATLCRDTLSLPPLATDEVAATGATRRAEP